MIGGFDWIVGGWGAWAGLGFVWFGTRAAGVGFVSRGGRGSAIGFVSRDGVGTGDAVNA